MGTSFGASKFLFVLWFGNIMTVGFKPIGGREPAAHEGTERCGVDKIEKKASLGQG